ncbi:MAG: 6-phosphofructokinase [Thermoproteota archaeon]
MKVGILSGGGDAPGINAVIRAVVRKGIEKYGYDFVGIKDGWRGPLEKDFFLLDITDTSGILPRGGSILGNTRTNPFKYEDGAEKTLQNLSEEGIEAVVAIGGEDTLGVAHKMHQCGLKCVGVPKTIDNDVAGTDYTFGFHTAVAIATEALDRLHTTAEAHHRVMILEVMGRYTGWIALGAGLAGGADAILIPEKPFDIHRVCEYVQSRQERGKYFSTIVVAEGARPEGGEEIIYGKGVDQFGHVRFGGVGYYIGKEIEKHTDIETRVVVLGHIQRGGSPVAYDRILATRYGVAAIDLVNEKKFGNMVALRGNKIIPVPLKDIAGKQKTVDLELYDVARVFFG